MKLSKAQVVVAATLMASGSVLAQSTDLQNAAPKSTADVGAFPPGTVITKDMAVVAARDIYVWGWPIVNAFHRRASFANAPQPGLQGGILPVAPTGYVAMLSHYIDPSQRWVAHPNQDVVYGFGYAAVDKDPVVLQVPDFGDRFWVYALYDARSDEFSRIGKQYGTKPGNYLVVGPNWKGEIPKGFAGVLHAPTELVAMGPRVFLDDSDADRAAIQPILNQAVIYPLSKYTGKKKTVVWSKLPHFPAAQSSSKSETTWVDPNTFFDELPKILEQVPPLPGEEGRYAMISAMLAAANKDPDIKKAITQAAVDTEKNVIDPMFDFRTNGSALPGGWNTPSNGAAFGYDYVTRTATAKSNMYVNQPSETRYFFIQIDQQGQRLNGSHRYTLTFPKGQMPPVNGFWSLTMYDPQHFFVPNPLKRYSVGTKNVKNMAYNADGSLTIYIQRDSPGKDKEANWLPAPQSEFEMTIRTYWPKPEVNAGGWSPPTVQQTN